LILNELLTISYVFYIVLLHIIWICRSLVMIKLLSYCSDIQKVTYSSFSVLIHFAMLVCWSVIISLMVLGLVPCNLMRLISWLMCLLSSMLCLGVVKLINSRCLCELWYACMITLFIALLCIHTYALLHILRYARCNTWRIWHWSQTQIWCLVDPSRRWKDRSPSGFHLTNSNLSWILGKPRSIIRLSTFQLQILYMCYMYCCITYRSWVKTLLHQYHSLSRYMNP
jgi:hypothetical protein